MGKKSKRSSALTLGRVSITRDPRVYADQVDLPLRPLKRVCGIDLGTDCGIAHADFLPGRPIVDTPIVLGQWDLSIGKHDSGSLRHIRLKSFLSILSPDLIMFEDVKYVPPKASFGNKLNINIIAARITPTAEFLGGLKTTVMTWAEERKIPYHGVAVAELKSFATGRGNATKTDMINAANERFGLSLDPVTADDTGAHNMADAAFVCLMGLTLYSEGLT